MRYLYIFILLVSSLPLFGQFRMVGNASWTTVNDSTYAGTVTFQTDLTGMGYLATQVADTFLVFTGTEQQYRIFSVAGQTFSTAYLVIIEQNGDWGVPVGQVMVYDPNPNATTPQVPFGSNGATSQMQAAVNSFNVRLVPSSLGTVNQDTTVSVIDFDSKLVGSIHIDLDSISNYTITIVTGGVDGSCYAVRITETNVLNTNITWPANVYLEDGTLAGIEAYTQDQTIPVLFDGTTGRYIISFPK